MSKIRVRQHVNPLSKKYQTPVTPPHWSEVYSKVNQPLHLDIGCAKGEFLLKMATLQPDWNFLGLEIREALVKDANQLIAELGLKNLHYLFGNANNSLVPIFESLPHQILQQVTIQFPDPWFKKRQMKRRVVKPEMVEDLAKYLAGGGWVFLQSDVEAVAREMCSRFSANSAFSRKDKDWLETNPLPIPTEREIYTISRGEAVYRAVFVKNEVKE